MRQNKLQQQTLAEINQTKIQKVLSAKINKLKLQELLNVFFVPNVTTIKRRAKSVCSFKNFKPIVYQPVNLGEARNRWGLDEEK